MACKKGKSSCEICKKEFDWRRHDSQPDAKFCSKSCTNIDWKKKLKIRNEIQFKYEKCTKEEIYEKNKVKFLKKLVKKEGCWDWNGCVDKNGYSQFNGFNGKRLVPIKGHRFSYELHKGKIPNEYSVCHTCDNPICTNPDHLWTGTPKQNSDDKVKKCRSSRGEKRWNSKLQDSDIKQIRKCIESGVTVAHLSRVYNVSYMTVQNVKNGKTWKHIIT